MKKEVKSVVALLTAAMLFTLGASPVSAALREFVGTSGQTLTAEIVKATTDTVTLKRTDGRTVKTKISVFSPDDQAFIAKWRKEAAANRIPQVEISIRSGKTNKEADDVGYDHWRQTFDFEVKVTNRERDMDIDGAKGVLFVFGKHVANSSELKLLSRQEFPVNIPSGGTLTFSAKPFESVYIDIDYSRSGHKYNSHLVAILNGAGKLIATESAPDTVAKYIQNALELSSGDICNRMLRNPQAAASKDGGGTVIVQ